MNTVMKRQIIRKRITYISFFLFPATFIYFSPYVIVGASAKGIMNGSIFMFGLLFLNSVVLGRAFCGWVCPLGGGQDMLSPLNNKPVKKGNIIKWLLWAPWIISIIIVAILNGGYNTIDPLYGTVIGFSLTSIYTMFAYLAVLLLVLLPFFVFGKRSFCHHICWISPFMIIGRSISNKLKLPSLKLIKTANECLGCQRCSRECEMSLDVADMVKQNKLENIECILCGTCADVCKRKCIELKFKP